MQRQASATTRRHVDIYSLWLGIYLLLLKVVIEDHFERCSKGEDDKWHLAWSILHEENTSGIPLSCPLIYLYCLTCH
jgi:hypothetical protein